MGKRRITPFDAPIKKPCGPFFEIVQPGTGSFHAPVTVIDTKVRMLMN